MTDKKRRKEIKDELRANKLKEFEASLPITRDQFKSLFDYLDLVLQSESCNDDYTITSRFLSLICPDKEDEAIGWLLDHNGYCDCEVLANVEELFE